jgi:hypothetical protein
MMYMMIDKGHVATDQSTASRLQFVCKNCSHVENEVGPDAKDEKLAAMVHADDEKPEEREKGQCIIESNYSDQTTSLRQFVNPHLVHDPTLPHVGNIKCPNADCSKTSQQPNDVIYAVVDKKDKKLIFHCCYCQHTWHIK